MEHYSLKSNLIMLNSCLKIQVYISGSWPRKNIILRKGKWESSILQSLISEGNLTKLVKTCSQFFFAIRFFFEMQIETESNIFISVTASATRYKMAIASTPALTPSKVFVAKFLPFNSNFNEWELFNEQKRLMSPNCSRTYQG